MHASDFDWLTFSYNNCDVLLHKMYDKYSYSLTQIIIINILHLITIGGPLDPTIHGEEPMGYVKKCCYNIRLLFGVNGKNAHSAYFGTCNQV